MDDTHEAKIDARMALSLALRDAGLNVMDFTIELTIEALERNNWRLLGPDDSQMLTDL